MKTINSTKEFYEVIDQDKDVIVYFYTNWCPDCFAVKPIMPRLEDEHKNLEFYSMDRDSDIDLARHLNIFGIPSFVIFKAGEEKNRYVDKQKKSYMQIKDFIEKTL